MGREIRRVHKDWQHPVKDDGTYIPLFQGFKERLSNWNEEKTKWDEGFIPDFINGGYTQKDNQHLNMSFEKWKGEKPTKEDFMPDWNEDELTHIQLYENTSEGTPLSPVFLASEFEELCEYASKNCSTFAKRTASKDDWMKMFANFNPLNKDLKKP